MKHFFKSMSRVLTLAAFTMVGMFSANTAQAGVDINVDLTTQRMNVIVDGVPFATWKVSTGRRGYTTPTGNYRPKWLKRMHYSRKYDNAPMPHSIFYHGGFAIHATYSIRRLGRVASHGCVRLHPDNARTLFNLVKREGRRNTRIKVYRSPRIAKAPVKVKKRVSALKQKSYSVSRKKTKRTNISRSSSRKRVVFVDNKRPVFLFGGLDLFN